MDSVFFLFENIKEKSMYEKRKRFSEEKKGEQNR